MIDRVTTYGPPILNPADAFRHNVAGSAVRSSAAAANYTNYEYGMTPANPSPLLQPSNAAAAGVTSQSRMVTRSGTRSVSVPQRSIMSTQTINGVPVGSTVATMLPGSVVAPMGPMDLQGMAGVPGQMTETAFQRSLINGAPIDAITIREDKYLNGMNRTTNIYNETLKRENDALRAEVHRLRKIEAGWFPGGPDEETRVTVINNYQNQINQNLEEISNLRVTVQQVEIENQQLREQLQIAQANPKYEKRIEELQRTITKLNGDLAAARSSSTASSVSVERTYSAQLEALRSAKLELERELRTLQSQMSQTRENTARSVLDERQKMSALLDAERLTVQKLRDELTRQQRETMRAQSQSNALPAVDPKMRMLQDQLSAIMAERDRLSSVVMQLEARSSSAPAVERVFDDTGIKERERLIEHYKAKWDELNAENARLKSQMSTMQDEFQRVRVKSEASVTQSSSSAAALRKEKELQDLLRQELELAKEDSAYYRNENQRLRDQLRKLSSQTNKTEIHREVIIDKTGSLTHNILNNPSAALNPPLVPGEADLVSRSVYRNTAGSTRAVAADPPMSAYSSPLPATSAFRPMTDPVLQPLASGLRSPSPFSSDTRGASTPETLNHFRSSEQRITTETVQSTDAVRRPPFQQMQ